MLNLKEAAAKGKLYVSALFKGEGARDFLLEEIDISKDKKQFLITVSFLRSEKKPIKRETQSPSKLQSAISFATASAISPSVQALLELSRESESRLFKTAVIDASSGELIKIVRDVADIAA